MEPPHQHVDLRLAAVDMPNWARSSIHATGNAAAAARFVDDFMEAYEKGLWGDEGASVMHGVFETSMTAPRGGPRACWWAQRGKPSGKHLVHKNAAVSFAGKWCCCYTLDELVKMRLKPITQARDALGDA